MEGENPSSIIRVVLRGVLESASKSFQKKFRAPDHSLVSNPHFSHFFLTFRNCTFSSIPVRPQIGQIGVVPWCCARSGSLSCMRDIGMRDPALETLRCARAARAISPTGFIPVDTRRSISHTMGTRSDAVAPPFLRKVYVWPAGKETLRRWRRFSRMESNGAPETDSALDADRPQVSHRG